jgi:peptidoglycan/LPS O-acetylase OafA/YrhL
MEASKSSTRLPAIDALRFVAALGVLLYHFLYAGPKEGVYPGISPVVGFSLGWLGVDVFFVISGLVIAISTEGRTARDFAKARFLRLFPAFFLCSLAGTVAWGIFSPDKLQMFISWLVGLTFLPNVFGYAPRLSVYWTLTIEVTFYIWVFVFIVLGIWRRHLNAIMLVWLSIALLNQFVVQSDLIALVLVTDFAGHFCAGMVLYQLIRDQRTAVTPLILLLSWVCFYSYNIGYFSYMEKAFSFSVDQRFVPFVGPVIVGICYASAMMSVAPSLLTRLFSVLGLASYPLYLIHTDVGHGGRMFLDRVAVRFPSILEVATPWVHMALAIGLSVAFSIVFALWIENRARNILRALITRLASPSGIRFK